MKRFLVSALLPACGLLGSCTQNFQPDGAYDGRLAVYAILTASSDTQYVRLSQTYQSTPGGAVTDALVDIVPGDGSPAVHFRDTTVVHVDASGQVGTYNVYVAYNFRPKAFVSYALSASSPTAGSAQGTTVALGPADVRLAFPTPQSNSPDSIVVTADFGTSTGAYVLRLFVEYTVTSNGGVAALKSEVPLTSTLDPSGKTLYEYPAFVRVPPLTPDNGFATAIGWFPQSLYAQTKGTIMASYPAGSVQFTGVMYTMTQIDDALYDYYYVLNGPKDLSTTRLDEPDFTNLTHGIGVIASTQMIVHDLPLPQ